MRVNHKASEHKRVKALWSTDPWLNALSTANYAQIDTWIDTNINNLASARKLFKVILKLLIFLVRRKL